MSNHAQQSYSKTLAHLLPCRRYSSYPIVQSKDSQDALSHSIACHLLWLALFQLTFANPAPLDKRWDKTTTITKSTTVTKSATVTKSTTVTKTAAPSPTGSCFLYYGSFDQLTVTDPATAYNPINFYDSVYYTSGLVQYIPGPTGVVPNSGDYFAVWSELNAPVQGTPGFSANYAQSTIYAINLYSFYYGCAIQSEESLVGLPVACNFTLTAYDINGAKIASKDFSFVPDSLTTSMMRYGAFPSSFQQNNAYSYAFSFDSTLEIATTVGLYDSLLYSVCGNGSIAGNS